MQPQFLSIYTIVKKFAIIIVCFVLSFSMRVAGQQLAINEAKKAITGLTMTVDSYNKAFNKLKPALTNDETKDRAETWALASRIKVEQYDKYMDNRRVGKKIDVQAMGHTLIDAYDYSMQALKLDTVFTLDKKGQQVIDKKTKRPKYKIKFSKEVVDRLLQHHESYRMVGSELYNIKDWDGAYKAWDDYCEMAARTGDLRWLKPDSMVAEVRYFQGITAWQRADTLDAVRLFNIARRTGYDHKEVYDYTLVCLNDMGDEIGVVRVAREAFRRFGTTDPQYVRILINDFVSREDYSGANDLLDKAIAANPDDDELQNLKGLVIENQQSIYEAFPYYQRCIELNDNNAQGLFNVGRYFYNKAMETRQNSTLYGKRLADLVNPIYREALPYLERSYVINPYNDDVRNALRDIYYKLGEADKLQALEKSR